MAFNRRGWIRRSHWLLLFAMLGGGAASVGVPLLALLLYALTQSRVQIEFGIRAIGFIAIVGVLAGAASGLMFAVTIRVEAPSADEVASTFE
jgi:hypothetical protein